MDMLKSGDLLFVSRKDILLPGAIAESTGMGQARLNYSHVGIVELGRDGRLWVLHADSGKGCWRDRLSHFLRHQVGRIDLYRPKNPVDTEDVLRRARSMLGQPYNVTFDPSEQGWYCSNYVWYAFKKTGLFHPIPMQFGPGGKKVLPFWRAYFRKLGREIPVGKPGIAPNTLILQGGLKFLGTLSFGK